MTYTKPELLNVASAIASIQSQTNKAEQEVNDADPLNINQASQLAYAADE